MAEENENKPREDAPHSSEAPTLSGYREYAHAMSGNDQAAKQRLSAQPEPVRAAYDQLYAKEQRLRDHSRVENYLSRMKSFVADLRDQRIPQINGQSAQGGDWHVRTEYEQWARDRKDLHARQRAAFQRDMEDGVYKWSESHGRDTVEFMARREVIERYCGQHEALNARTQNDMTGYIDRAIDRQFELNRRSMDRNEGALLDEIVRGPRESTKARDSGRER